MITLTSFDDSGQPTSPSPRHKELDSRLLDAEVDTRAGLSELHSFTTTGNPIEKKRQNMFDEQDKKH